MRSFAEAMEAIPLSLAENSGYNPIQTVADIKSRQVAEKNPRLGIDCMNNGSNGKHENSKMQLVRVLYQVGNKKVII
jgi:chaperonin GroEL (HSP60 family)